MKKALLVAIFLLPSASVWAGSSLTDQINAVHAVELRQQEADRAAQAAYEEEAARAAEKQRAEATRLERTRAAERAAKRTAEEEKAKEAVADRKRDQTYEDQLRDVDLQMRQVELQKMKARANRENDYIDQDLRHKAAETDAVQSKADAERNLSEGGKSLMQSTGEARIKESSGWFK
jgi:hypothetical protein